MLGKIESPRVYSLGLVALIAAFGLQGCAGGSLAKIDAVTELPRDLPKEYHDKFEVKDSPEQAVAKAEGAQAPIASDVLKTQAVSAVESTPPTKAAKTRKKRAPKNQQGPAPAASVAQEEVAAVAPIPVQIPSRRPAKDPIQLGEKMVLDITYFGMSAGDFTLEVLPYKAIADRKVYHVRGTAISSKVFSLFYRLNDTIETFMDYEGLFSHRFHLVLDETKQVRDSLELFDFEKNQTFYWNRWNRKEKGYVETKEFAPIPPLAQDSLSVLYYVRTLSLPDGAVVTIPVVSEGKSWEAVITVVRREMMDTPMGRIQTIVIKPEMKFQGVLKNQGDSFLWLSDDDHRYVVRLEAKVRIGTVVANLKQVEPGSSP